ncbi:MAG: HDIG domain-containing metalloprotein [Anaerolineae bacterium]
MDLSPYAGRWIALVGDDVAGVGHTAAEALHLAQRNRPKERAVVRFIESPGGEALTLSPMLDRLRPFFENQPNPVYLVGGAVRDALLGRPSHDLDFAVPGGANQMAFRAGNFLNAPAYVLDKKRDTGRVVLQESRTTLDFARFRARDLEADLKDRDFTINALALPATARTQSSIIDPCGGLADLTAGVIRLTHPQAVHHDPVRALRAVRLALELGFTLDESAETAVSGAADELAAVSVERVRDELLKCVGGRAPDRAVRMMARFGLLAAVLPSIAALAGIEQSSPHREAVLPHTITTLRWLVRIEKALTPDGETAGPLAAIHAALADFTPGITSLLNRAVPGGLNGRTLLRLGALFHDVGKQETKTTEQEEHGGMRIRFLGHETAGAPIAAAELRRLCLSNEAVAHVQRIVAGHMRPMHLTRSQPGKSNKPLRLTRRAIYRYFRDTGSAGIDIGLISLADHLATHDSPGDPEQWQRLVSVVAQLFRHYFEHHAETVAPPPLLDGRELMTVLQLGPGPEVGRLLRLIEEAQAAGELTTKAEALDFARRSRQ